MGCSMEYNERVKIVQQEITNLLNPYKPTAGLDEKQQAAQIQNIAKAINGIFPADTTPDHIRGSFERAGRKLTTIHNSFSWPSANQITKVVRDALTAEERDNMPTTQAQLNEGVWRNGKIDHDLLAAQQIKARQDVSESYITGLGAERLLKKGLVTPADLEPYARYLREEKRKLYGQPVEYTEHEPQPQQQPAEQEPQFVPW